MTVIKIFSTIFLGLIFMPSFAVNKPDTDMKAFIDNLMAGMTLREKIGQLNLPVSGDIVTGQAKSSDVAELIRQGQVGGLFNLKGVGKIREMQDVAIKQSRLHIPLLFGMDVIHGYETVFPIPLSLSYTWDLDAIKQSARIAAIEASADGINWTFSPMVDISRDPRWGRMSEGSGEDPYLGSLIAKAMVEGYQGNNYSDNRNIMACVKHFALYGAIEAGREYNTVDMSRWRMFNDYFPPYKAAVNAGAGSVMTSFNVVDGIPSSGNRWLLTDVLRNQWGFNGFVVTDYTAIEEMTAHGLGDLSTVSALALNAGTDMDMVSNGFVGTIEQSVNAGRVSEKTVNTACRRILEAKYKLGLFDNPYKYCDEKRAKTDIYTSEHRAVARRIAAESFVLLKNDGNLLPLKRAGKIALIGPLANTAANMPGTWSVAATPERYKSLLQAMQDAVGNSAQIIYAKGSNLMYDAKIEENSTPFGREIRDNRPDSVILYEAVRAANQADVVVAAIGESSEMSGECSSRSDVSLPDAQRDLLVALKKTGKPVVLLYFAGRPTVMTWETENFSSIMNVGFGGSEAGDAICDVLFGDKVPCGKLTATFPKSVGQIPLYYNALPTGRPLKAGEWFTKFRSNYLDIDNDPLFPFGFGLSYTTFSYGKPVISTDTLTAGGDIKVSVGVTNTGNYDGCDIVQLYTHDLAASVSRPVKELKGFERISLKKGETRIVTFAITAEMLKFYDQNLRYNYEPGDFDVMVGPNSKDVQTLRFILR